MGTVGKKPDDLKTTKSLIRSILISAQDGLTVREFQNDYEEFVGKRVPFADSGFSSVRAFLQSLTDVVQFFESANGEEKIRQVSDQSTIHIEKLVAKQKAAPKKKKKGGASARGRPARGGRGGGNATRGGGGGRWSSGQNRRPPLLNLTTIGQQSTHATPVSSKSSSRSPAWKMLPSGHQQDPQATDDENWDDPPSETRGSIYQNVDNFHITIQNNQTNRRDILINQNMQQSHNFHAASEHSDSTRNDYGDHMLYHEDSFKGQMRQGMQPSRGRGMGRKTTAGRGAVSMHPYGDHSQFAFEESKSSLSAGNGNGGYQYQSDYCYEDVENGEELAKGKNTAQAFPIDEDSCEISKGLQQKIKQVIMKAPKGMWAKRLPVVFKEMHKYELPLREQGFHSVVELVSAMPHIVRVERPYENGDWLLSDATQAPCTADNMNQQQQLAANMTKKDTSYHSQWIERNISPGKIEDLKESVRQVLQAHTDGVPLSQFANIYREMTGRLLKPKSFGEKDINSLLVALSHFDVLRMEYRGADTVLSDSARLYAIPTTGVRRFHFLKDGYKPHSFETAYWSDQDSHLVPSGVVGSGRCYTPASMKGVVKKSYLEVHVSNVISPAVFWVQKRRDLPALDTVMDGLEAVYTSEHQKYKMPESHMVHGQVCATLYPEDSNWHRCIISGVADTMVQVFYVDYGNTCEVPASTVCYLREDFLTLPAQAIQAKLAYVQPPAGQKTFSNKCKQVMLEMVTMRPLMALVADIQDHVLSLVLVDTTGEEDLYINDRLVKDGLAEFVPNDQTEARKADGGTTQRDPPAPLSPVYVEGQRYIRPVEFNPEIGFYLINLDGCLYITSADISYLFWEEDILAEMLQDNRLGVSILKMGVSRKQFPGLFAELLSFGVHYVSESTQTLTLYSFDCLPLLLDLFGNQSSLVDEVKNFIMFQLQTFDPSDPFWKGTDEETGSSCVSEGTDTLDDDHDHESVLTMEELQLALRSLQINRKRILKRMTSQSECSADDVQELEQTESSITQIQDVIQNFNLKNTTGMAVPSTGKSAAKTPVVKTAAPVPKTESSQSVTENQGPATKDITAKLPSSPPASSSSLSTAMLPQGSSTLPDLPLQDLDIMAANKQLAEEIRQNDHLISSMLGMPGGEVGVGSPMDSAWMKLPDLQLFPQQPGFGQLMSNTAQPQGVAGVSQVKTTPNPSQAHILPNPGQSQVLNQGQGFLNPSQSQGFPNPSQSQGFPNPSQSQGFPNLGQGHVLPNPGQQQFFTSSVQSQLFPVSSVPQGIQAPRTALDSDLSLSAGSSVQPLPAPGPGLVQQGMPKSFQSPGSGRGVSGLSHVFSSELTVWRPVGGENPGQPVSSQSTTAPRPSAAVGMIQPQGTPRLPSPTSVFRPPHLIDHRHPAPSSNFVRVGAPMWAPGAPASQTDPAGSMWQPRAPAANSPVPSQHTWTQLPPSTAAQQQGFQQQVMLQQQQMMMMRPLPSYLLRARLPGQVRPGVAQPTEGWPTNWAAPPGPSQLPPSVPGMASPPQAAPHMLGNPRVLGAPGVGGGGDGGRGVSEPAQDGTGQLLPSMLPGGQETGGQLLPGMMPLLESLKAGCVISPPAPSSSASSRPQ